MTSHDWFIEHRTEYAARVLDDAEMAAFAAHVADCVSCRDAVARIEADLAWLPMAASPVTPPASFHKRALANAVGRGSARWRQWALPIGIAASLASGIGGWQLGRRRASAPTDRVALTAVDSADPAAIALAALRDTLSIMRGAARVGQARITLNGTEGGMVIFADPVTHRWNVVVHGLPQPPADGRYQFWFIRADGMVRGSVVTVDPSRPMIFTTGMPPGDATVLGAALTIEPMDANGPTPQGRSLAHILL